jgi:hypothetical protein
MGHPRSSMKLRFGEAMDKIQGAAGIQARKEALGEALGELLGGWRNSNLTCCR